MESVESDDAEEAYDDDIGAKAYLDVLRAKKELQQVRGAQECAGTSEVSDLIEQTRVIAKDIKARKQILQELQDQPSGEAEGKHVKCPQNCAHIQKPKRYIREGSQKLVPCGHAGGIGARCKDQNIRALGGVTREQTRTAQGAGRGQATTAVHEGSQRRTAGEDFRSDKCDATAGASDAPRSRATLRRGL